MHFLNKIIANQLFWYAFVLFLVSNVAYITMMKMMVAGYYKRKSKKPLHFKLYRYYNPEMVKKVTSKSEKAFYLKSNRVTVLMNSIIILSAVYCIYSLSK